MSDHVNDLRERLERLTPQQRESFLSRYEKRELDRIRKERVAPDEAVHLSPAQLRLWYLSRANDGDPSYNIPGFFSVDGDLSVQEFRAAVEQVMLRHDVLRGAVVGDPPLLKVVPEVPAPVERVEIPRDARDVEEWAAGCAKEFVRRPFSISRPPLFRILLICVEGTPRYVVCSFHHLVFDGWSLKVFMGELLTILGGGDPAPPTWGYRDHVVFEGRRRRLLERMCELSGSVNPDRRDEDFWKDYLSGIPQSLGLPGARPATGPSNAGGLHIVRMDEAVWARLQKIGRDEDVTPFSVALGLFSAVLARSCGESDIVVGTPVSGRQDPLTHGLIGTFVNTVPVRVTVDASASTRSLVREVSRSSTEALSYDHVPFERIVDIVNPLRSSGTHPIFRVLFTFQPALTRLSGGGVSFEYRDLDFGTSKFDLSLDIVDEGSTIRLVFEYRSDVLSRDAVAEIARTMLVMAEEMARRPEDTVGSLSLLSEERRTELLRVCRGPRCRPRATTLLEAFEDGAARFPQREAVRDVRSVLTYEQLDKASTDIALRLASVADPGEVVAIVLPRSSGLLAALLGAWKAGATPLVVDPSAPLSRIQAMVNDCQAVVVTERGQLAEVTGIRDKNGAGPWILSELPRGEIRDDVFVEDPQAYLVYTSGSTGRPKGILVSQKSYVHVMEAWRQRFSLDGPCVAQIASSAFDVFYGDVARALGTGGRLVIVSSEIAANPDLLADLLAESGPDFVEFVPSVFRRLAAYLRQSGRRLHVPHVVVASEKWTMGEARQWEADVLGAGSQLDNTYGLAETTIDSTGWVVRTDDPVPDEAPVPIGSPLPGAAIYVVDEQDQLLPRFVIGEVLIGGECIDNRYVGGAEDLNVRYASVVVGSDGRAERVFRTGDYAYWDWRWRLVLVGRRDGQVKIRGVRIELSEVDNAVRRLAGVSDCASVVREDESGTQLVTWVVSDASDIDTQMWRSALLNDLPTAMVPQIVLTDSLPFLASGKIDREQLVRRHAPDAISGRVAPRDDVERKLCDLFCEVLECGRVGVEDDFFALGGHSLTALDLVGRIKRGFNVDMRISDLFDCPTVEGLAHRIAQRSQAGSGSEDYPIVEPDPRHRYDGFPLTDVQQAYWLGRNDAFEFSGVSTHSYDEFHGRGLDPRRFADALNEVIARHDMMRCVIVDHGEQRVLPEVPRYDPWVYDLRNADNEEVEAHLAAVREELSHQRLDVTSWPNFDIRVSALPGDLLVLHFSTDALLLDAKSFVLIAVELSRIHDGLAVDPVSDFRFRDYVLAEIESRGGDRYRRSEAFWKSMIPKLPAAPDLPMRGRPDDVVAPRFTRLHARVEKDRWDELKGRCGVSGLTPSSLCLAAYAMVLARYSRSPEFCINMTFLSRKPFHEDVEQIVGEFTSVTLLPIAVDLREGFLSNAVRIQRRLWEVLEFNDMTGVRVQREYARYHGTPASAHFPVVFTSTLGGMPMPDESFPMRHQPEYGVTQTSQVWLDCGIWEDDRGDLRCNWDIVREVYPEGMLDAMFHEWVALIDSLAVCPAAWEEPAPVVVPKELASEGAPRGTLLDGFLQSVARRPDAAAVVTSDGSMSYGELAAVAGGVALRLRELAVERGELVAVLMEPGWEQVAAVLGIVGRAAYVPVGPAMPDERLARVLTQAGVRVVLTQQQFRARVEALLDVTAVVVDEGLVRADGSAALHESTARPDDLAYVIFTSGSTGTPKGVMISHRAALNTIDDVNERFGVTEDDSVLAISELSFDLSVYDIFGMMCAGGAVVVPDRTERLDPICLVEMVRDNGVTVWNSVPALFQLYLSALDEGAEPPLRLALLSGDWIPLGLPARAALVAPGVRLHSLGGATEASIWSITYAIDSVDPEWVSIPYGVGMRYQDVVVLDRRLSECRDWVVGDLFIRGAGLALGYWDDPDQTAAAFISHPVTGERMYRTGDLGRRRPDGVIEFLGRSDFQLKIGGYRVEAGEVEKAVCAHPAVHEAAVVAVGSGLGDKRLACAWTRVRGSQGASDAELAAVVSGKLQEYMVPSMFSEVDEMPLSSNGKIDRARVAAVFEHSRVPDAVYVAPRTDDEARMVELWASVLKAAPRIGMHDDFFELGGSSVDAIELVTRVRRRWGLSIKLADLYEASTPAQLLLRLRAADAGCSDGGAGVS
ncbi:non-ribosomal peptide synthetase [Actinomyces qiguomingii]|uniref:non-ribosomal peptide synthetase n=1 Tax=Actinomyces qiguomingii TaxID=2057800 RepID=UPI001304D605|nr:non-ribosomal peptide synthetase [Actinomyces qiguomingii]